MSIVLVDPTTATTADAFHEAARPTSLDGANVALLANGKTHGEFLLHQIIAQLNSRYSLGEVRIWTKPHPSGPPTGQQLSEIKAFADVVISAIGDCGSCSSCSVFDGMNFEKLGIPSAIVISRPFLPTAAAIARLNGADNFQVVAIGHPVTSKDAASLIADAAEAAPHIERILLAGHGSQESGSTTEGILPGRDDMTINDMLQEFREALNNDGTDIELIAIQPDRLELKLVTSGASCSDCVLPTAAISAMLQSAFQNQFGPRIEVELTDDRTG
jgi:Fe-S cluster biogenesis protein NfuA